MTPEYVEKNFKRLCEMDWGEIGNMGLRLQSVCLYMAKQENNDNPNYKNICMELNALGDDADILSSFVKEMGYES